jgi:signal transduction histidine kinase
MSEEYEVVLREIYSVIADSEMAFDAKVEALLEIGRATLDTEYGALSHVQGDEYVFEIVHDPEGETQPGDVVPLGETNCERAVDTEETLVLTDIAEEAPELATRGGFTEQGIRCYIGTPVTVNGEIYGTFCFYDRDVRTEPFSKWEITLVDFMGKWISYELERNRREVELSRQRDQLENVANIIAHDLRNPLSAAIVQLQLARQQFDGEHLEEVDAALTRMEEIIDAVLSLAHVNQRSIDTGVVDLEDVVLDACVTAAPESLSVSVCDDAESVVADESLLKQLFENLLRNAVEHVGPETEVCVGSLEEGNGFYVEDDGPGIPESEREQVLQTGYSNLDDGTGFGLNIVERIAEVHDWSLTLTESSMGGVRFEFEDVRCP